MMTRPGPARCLKLLVVGSIMGASSIISQGWAEESSDADRAAAAKGDAAALVRLATRYETGDAVPFDLDHAAVLLEQAAMRGDVTAQYRFGLMQAGGADQADDLADAYGWMLLAETADPDHAEALLGDAVGEAVAASLDEMTIEAAEAWVAAFAPMSGPVDLPTLLGEVDPRVELAKLEQDLGKTGCGRPARQTGATGATGMLVYASTGAVDDAGDLGELRAGFADHGIALDVADLSPALCDLRSLLTASPDRLIETGVTLADVASGAEAELLEGDRLILDIAPADGDRHVAVDYLVHTGDVLHLYPPAGDVGKLPANQTLRLGDGSDGLQPWQVGAPFGRDLLVVTISDQAPSADRMRRPTVGPATSYLTDWRARIDSSDADRSWQVFERVILTKAR